MSFVNCSALPSVKLSSQVTLSSYVSKKQELKMSQQGHLKSVPAMTLYYNGSLSCVQANGHVSEQVCPSRASLPRVQRFKFSNCDT